jgi:glycosyltransferase involved in cell wall biosynthesis
MTLHVGINARALEKPNPSGVSRYTDSLVKALAGLDRDLTLHLFGVRSLPPALADADAVRNAGVPAPAHSGGRAHLWEQLQLPRRLGGRDLDVFHTPAGQPPVLASLPLVTTIHDISPISHPEWFSTGYAALYRVLTPVAVRRSTRLVGVSEFTRDELVEAYPRAAGKAVAIPNGVRALSESDAPPETGGDLDAGAFLLFVGSTNPRKNVATLLEAYRLYRQRTAEPLPLTLAGPDRDVFASADAPQVEGVRPLGFVSEEALAWLYRNAAAFVFPTLYEGFGMPILEAMGAGTPVVTSDRGAMAEVAGDAAALVDPQRPAEMADAIERVVGDEAYRERLVEAGRERAATFTWERTARETADVYREAAASGDR